MGLRGLIFPLSSSPPPPPQNGGLLVAVLPTNYSNINSLLGGQSSGGSFLTPKHYYSSGLGFYHHQRRSSSIAFVSAKKSSSSSEEEEPKKERKQNLFESVTQALDFSQVRSAEDAQLLEEAREATKSGDKMSREQYGALRRKIGGTYKDFFKSYIDVDGEYVEEGWVDKTCKVCKKDTKGEARQADKFGRYVHVACLENNSKSGGNFFTRLFS